MLPLALLVLLAVLVLVLILLVLVVPAEVTTGELSELPCVSRVEEAHHRQPTEPALAQQVASVPRLGDGHNLCSKGATAAQQ